MGIHQLPKPILKEQFNLQLWSPTSFQYVKVLFHSYTSFQLLESFAYCVPLNTSLRSKFSQNCFLDYILILYERFILQLDSNPEPLSKQKLNHLCQFGQMIECSGFESSCSHLNFRFRAYFEQGVPWHSGNYGMLIHSETRKWHDRNIQ